MKARTRPEMVMNRDENPSRPGTPEPARAAVWAKARSRDGRWSRRKPARGHASGNSPEYVEDDTIGLLHIH
jgi:hypothetical protein